MDSIALRIKELIEFKKMNISSFEKKIGAGNNSIGTLINRNSNVSGQILSKILNSFEDVSSDWLLTGKGEILRNSNQNLQLVATNDQLSGVDVDNRKLLLDIQEKVDFIYTHALKEMAKKELEGLKNDIKKTKEGKK